MIYFHFREGGVYVTRFIFWLLLSLTQSSIRLGAKALKYIFKNLMFNLKNNENDAVYDEIQKKEAKLKIEFQKMKDTFLDSALWLKSHPFPLIYPYIFSPVLRLSLSLKLTSSGRPWIIFSISLILFLIMYIIHQNIL